MRYRLVGVLGVLLGGALLAAHGIDAARPAVAATALPYTVDELFESTVGGSFYESSAINDSGQVVSTLKVSNGAQIDDYVATTWTREGGARRLEELQPGEPIAFEATTAADLNNAGEIVGIASASGADQFAGGGYIYRPATGFDAIPALGGEFGIRPLAINDAATVTGATDTGAFIWTADGGTRGLAEFSQVEEVHNPGGAFGVNASGQAVGYQAFAFSEFESRLAALFWNASGELQRSNLPEGAINGQLYAINNSGVALGIGWNAAGNKTAFLRHPQGLVQVLGPAVNINKEAALNDQGHAVYNGLGGGGRFFPALYRDAVVEDLSVLMPESSGYNFQLATPRDINNLGQILLDNVIPLADENQRLTVVLTPRSAPAPPRLDSVSVSPKTVRARAQAVGTVRLSRKAPAGGTRVMLKSTAGASVPRSVTVGRGERAATFGILTRAVRRSTRVTITATLGTTRRKTRLLVLPRK
jgi:hypothetical protein